MAGRDRLAAMRQERAGNPVPLQNYSTSNTNGTGSTLTSGDNTSNFFGNISSVQDDIKKFNANIARINELQMRSLNAVDDSDAQRGLSEELDRLVETTRGMSASLKDSITALERDNTVSPQIRKSQISVTKGKFVEALQNYQRVEQEYRKKQKQRLERQLKIVKPDATPDEIQAAVNDPNGGQVFSQALLNSTQYSQSRSAYREVQERHQDILRIERTLVEVAQLINDMSILVEQQDEQVKLIETQATKVEDDVGGGLSQINKATESARRARKMRWACFVIFIIVVIVVVLAVVLTVKPWVKK